MNGLSFVCSVNNIEKDADYIKKSMNSYITTIRLDNNVYDIKEITVDHRLGIIFIDAEKATKVKTKDGSKEKE